MIKTVSTAKTEDPKYWGCSTYEKYKNDAWQRLVKYYKEELKA